MFKKLPILAKTKRKDQSQAEEAFFPQYWNPLHLKMIEILRHTSPQILAGAF